MMARIFLCLFLLSLPPLANGSNITLKPAGLEKILQKIAARQGPGTVSTNDAAQIVIKDGQIIFLQHAGKVDTAVSFSEGSPTIVKHFRLQAAHDQYQFNVALKYNGKGFGRVVEKINGVDALFLFNDTDVFVYTQRLSNGQFKLDEWIYAIKPNAPDGSRWEWVFRSVPWEWPLTLQMDVNGQTQLNRQVPVIGIPIDKRAKDQYMLPVMVKFKTGENIDKYFPFKEKVGSIPTGRAWDKEGSSLMVDIKVSNFAIPRATPKPRAGFNLAGWEDHWEGTYSQSITAPSENYPILVGPADK
jgi:hypothetical protein